MTHVQKQTYRALLEGASIVCAASSGYRIIDSTGSPVARIQQKTFKAVHPLLRSTKLRGIFLINKNEVRKLNGNCWVKKMYKKSSTNMKKTTELFPKADANPNIKFYLYYARKNGLKQLELLVDALQGDAKALGYSAVEEYKMDLNSKPLKAIKNKLIKKSN
ncbi:MAG: hypothetical protein H7320_11545 [Ferruginibacter sp.]|nr:hypothetical protein [Ferruginibacter sp.]